MDFTLTFIKIFYTGIVLLIPMLSLFLCAILGLGVIVGKLEKWNTFDSLYWSFITATTVGYGDIRPSGKLARCLSIIIALSGLIFTGLVIAVALQAVMLTLNTSDEFQLIREQIKTLTAVDGK